MPGMLTGKLKQIADAIGVWWQSLGGTQADASVKESDVIETSEYIRSMGYDLIGYGFIPAKNIISNINEVKINDEGEYINGDGSAYNGTPGQYYDEYGILYSTGGDNSGASKTFETAGTIIGFYDYPNTPNTSLIRTYLLSNNRMFSIRNYDNEDSFMSWLQGLFGDTNENWSKGLISLYHTKNKPLIASGKYEQIEFGYIKANAASKTLNIKVGWNTNEMQFGMDGWSGRYGLSLEFLLSLHLGTMAPELVTTIARSFDTEIQVYLGDLKTDVTGWYKEDDAAEPNLTWKLIDENDKGWNPWISTSDARNIMHKFGIKSRKEGAYACEYSSPKTILYESANSGARYILSNYSTAGQSNYNDLVTKANAGKINNIINRKTSNGAPVDLGIDTWYEFMGNSTEDAYKNNIETADRHDSGFKVDWEGFDRVFAGINRMLSLCISDNTYNNWKDEEQENKTFSNNTGRYKAAVKQLTDADGNPIEGQFETDRGPTADRLDGNVTDETKDGCGLKDKMPFKEFMNIPLNSTAEFVICSFIKPDGSKRLVISIVATAGDWGGIDVSVIAYTEDVQPNPNKVCSDDINNIDSVCPKCQNYVKAIRDSLDKITMAENDDDYDLFNGAFKTYTPYIARVVDSWFRDTFFIVPSDSATDGGDDDDVAIKSVYADNGKRNNYGSGSGQIKLTGNNIEYVEVDEKYLKETDEYWSKYETYDDPTTGEKYYLLYQLNNNGTLNLTGHTYIRCADTDGKEVYKNTTTGATEAVGESTLKLVKRAKTNNNITSGWNSTGGVWSVYDNTAKNSSGILIPLVVGAGSDTKIKNVAGYSAENGGNYRECFYYEMAKSAAIQQKEDARRGITNPTIKQMFKIRKYYIYDGSEEKAQKIYEDWYGNQGVIKTKGTECYNDYKDKLYFKAKYQASPPEAQIERAVEMALDDLYYNNSGTFAQPGKKPEECDPRDKALIGNITINKDTLNAFSILENTKTLDAGYQYRDFKELIVELDYFDKEDLSDKPNRVLEWIIPSCTDKWPFDVIDKSKDYYGTLIHSNSAIAKLRDKLVINGVFADEAAIDETELGSATGYEFGKDIISPVTGEIINCGKYNRINTDKLAQEFPEETVESLKAQGRLNEIQEEVEFIQIKVLDEADINAIETACAANPKISVTIDGVTNEFEESEVWRAYYNEYTGVCAGHIITIEGIDLGGALDVEGLKTEITSRATLQANETPKLVDKNEEKKNKALEQAKVEKLPATIVVNGRLFVTEGAIIGKTVEIDTDYSYTRLILRDQKLGIVENLEDYFDFNDN